MKKITTNEDGDWLPGYIVHTAQAGYGLDLPKEALWWADCTRGLAWP